MGNAARLRAKIELALPELAAVGQALREHPHIDLVFPEYMFTMHCIIRSSVSLMRHALQRCTELEDDPVAALMAGYLPKHIREEMHHDDWLLDDLELLGFDRAELVRRQPAGTVAAMVGSQYYWIWHHHPVALLGYIAVMEGYPPTAEQLDELTERTGFPRAAFRTMSKHALLDPHHRDDLDLLLDALPLTSGHAALLGVSALLTIHWGSSALQAVIVRHGLATVAQ